MALDRLGHDRAVGVAGHADGAGDLLLAQLVERLERAVRGLDLRQVRLVGQAVEVEQIDAVGLQALETRLDLAQRRVARPRPLRHLGREPDLLAPRLHDHPDPRLAQPLAVVDRRVEVVDPEVDGAVEHAQRLLLVLVHEEPAAAPEGEDRDLRPRPPERPLGELRLGLDRLPGERRQRHAERRRPDELTTCNPPLLHL